MQTLTPNADIFHTKRIRFSCSNQTSTLIPTKPLSISPARKTNREHLKNLENVLKNSSSTSIDHFENVTSRQEKTNTSTSSLLGGLNLARIWPQMKAAVDEMSPKNLKRLQRLLSKSSEERSPKSKLGSKWKELHGLNNWAGLLDPLDEDLRRELVRYGEFVQAAYHAFHSDPQGSPTHVGLQDGSFKVTKSLYATSSVRLPKWIDDVAPDLRWMTKQTSWVGYVAVCDDPREIRRMGRREIVIALRGTATLLEWSENFRPNLVSMPEPKPDSSDPTRPKVECGFNSLYTTSSQHGPSLAESLIEEISRLVELYAGEELSISVTGHSLGAAIALLAADDIAERVPLAPPVAVFSFGGPRVGNREFADRLDSKGVKVLRVVNSQDVVTKVPGIFSDNDNNNGRSRPGSIMEMVERNNPWAYSHVGAELRVNMKMSPYLKPNADVACCHDLEAYLHLVDGFLASNCPFRANAKRSLRKLLDEQRSNVKVLYTGKSLRLNRTVHDNGDVLPSPSSS
ncbi:PREDICTED: phospholipase A1-Ibeta2, chloroplastic-like [Camelina sativa]|uniref:Phospholipase A1-Ibeta2, chloroplastic-like n=1 Tax=Camelina sativa TaxID=90675 RepID=A0ABM0V279_CAMSA|nr:PREDICTED: phospholipase A1-Ibeta2, chloroplastic-like [Camelina sativa]